MMGVQELMNSGKRLSNTTKINYHSDFNSKDAAVALQEPAMEDVIAKKEVNSSPEKSVTTVMVVDDEPNMCNVLQRILEHEGYRVIVALDGVTALRLIPTERPDAILLDIMMPGMHGREVCARAREVCDTSIIYFSARADLARTDKASELSGEADAFITKPATAKRILSVIDFALTKH